MGAPSSQVQSSQSSAPAGKGAGASPSSHPMGKGGASMSATSGQPTMGQPNTNSNTGMDMVNPTMIAQNDGQTTGNPYSNTVGQTNSESFNVPMPINSKNLGGGKGKGA